HERGGGRKADAIPMPYRSCHDGGGAGYGPARRPGTPPVRGLEDLARASRALPRHGREVSAPGEPRRSRALGGGRQGGCIARRSGPGTCRGRVGACRRLLSGAVLNKSAARRSQAAAGQRAQGNFKPVRELSKVPPPPATSGLGDGKRNGIQ